MAPETQDGSRDQGYNDTLCIYNVYNIHMQVSVSPVYLFSDGHLIFVEHIELVVERLKLFLYPGHLLLHALQQLQTLPQSVQGLGRSA